MDKKYLVFLMHCPALNSKKFLKLIKFFGSCEEILKAERKVLLESNILSIDDIDVLFSFKKKNNPDTLWESLKKKEIKIVTLYDEEYPQLLKKIYDPPVILYYKGQLPLSSKIISIVGTRRPTNYGKKISEKIARKLAEHGFIVASGMARGIDSYAHKGALSTGNETVAVLGSGVDVIYPPENKGLYLEIVKNGCIISEFPPGSDPLSWHFPVRNRIISGISRGVVVVEAGFKSGALITVDFALEQGREVFSVPGPITSKYSLGTNNLIKQGAKPVTCIEDIFEELEIQSLFNDEALDNYRSESLHSIDGTSKKILEQVEVEPCDVDTIARNTGLPLSEVNYTCIIMELKGLIKKLPGKKYIKDI